MIEIRNSRGELAELYPDTSISIEKNNPLFTEKDDLFEDISYSFKMPISDANKKFFNWGHLVETPNEFYTIPVQCAVGGYSFYAGTLKFGLSNGDFDALLLVNFGAVAESVKSVLLTDIYTADSFAGPINAQFMKIVCENPDDYPFSFFPVKNNDWKFDNDVATVYNIVNYWQDVFQSFLMLPEDDGFGYKTPQSAYFKLSYIITKIMEYLGLRVEGGWLEELSNRRIYIYNRIRVADFLFDSSYYYPDGYTIGEFLKVLKNDPRINLAVTIDVFNGVARLETSKHLIASTEVLDLTDYIYSVDEISVATKNGYSVSLKPDSNDAMFKVKGDSSTVIATNKIVVGNGENEIDVDASTLKFEQLDANRIIPITKQTLNGRTGTKQPIRFLSYNGMKVIPGNKVYPEATPMELQSKDADWYRFLSDGKTLKLSGAIPMAILSRLRSVEKISFISPQGNNTIALTEKVKYSLTNDNSEFINTTFEVRTIVANYSTQVAVAPINFINKEGKQGFKAFYQNLLNVSEINFEVYYPANTIIWNGAANVPIGVEKIMTGLIKQSTDKGRGGGHAVYLTLPEVNAIPNNGEIRVFIKPQYLVYSGKKYLFEQHANGYWFCKPFTSVAYTRDDMSPVWIVF